MGGLAPCVIAVRLLLASGNHATPVVRGDAPAHLENEHITLAGTLHQIRIGQGACDRPAGSLVWVLDLDTPVTLVSGAVGRCDQVRVGEGSQPALRRALKRLDGACVAASGRLATNLYGSPGRLQTPYPEYLKIPHKFWCGVAGMDLIYGGDEPPDPTRLR
jgi:hypothetical protein